MQVTEHPVQVVRYGMLVSDFATAPDLKEAAPPSAANLSCSSNLERLTALHSPWRTDQHMPVLDLCHLECTGLLRSFASDSESADWRPLDNQGKVRRPG